LTGRALPSASGPVGDAAWRERSRARRRREIAWQLFIAVMFAVLAVVVARNLAHNLETRQIRSGFGFLADAAGFNIGEQLFAYSASDSYLRAFAVGMANSLRVALAGIVLASLLGLVVALMRLSYHPVLRAIGAGWVEIFRNVPLLIQLLAIYLLATEWLPEVTEAWSLGSVALWSKEGLQVTVPEHGTLAVLCALGAFLFVGVLAVLGAQRWLEIGAGAVGIAAGVVSAMATWFTVGAGGGWSRPVLDGFLVSGGATLTPEFIALWLGLSMYTSASIAELVRAGVLAVPEGQSHAALALGFTRPQAMGLVLLPQALRLIVPPLASQYMNLIKNSSLAVVIGYPDLVSIANTAINQNGQALEVIAIIMAVYLVLNLATAAVMGAVNARVTRAPR
jgi:general L-amino acid transport system permease protein